MPFSFDLPLGTAVLARTPATLDAMLRDLPEAWTHGNLGPGTWSPYDIVGHLVHGERADWIARARIILEHGEGRPFDPFDREAQFKEPTPTTLAERLDSFASLREQNLATLSGLRLSAADLSRRGTHPELGPVTLGQLLATWVGHDLAHVRQIARTMARQWAGEVGAWRAYMPVMGPPA